MIVLLDADDDDGDDLRQRLLEDLRRAGLPPCRVAVAVKEFEAWFLASLPSLRGHASIRDDASFTGNPEVPRGAKGVLEGQMHEKYHEVLHQPAFAALMDLDLARRRSASCARLAQDVSSLISASV